MATLLHGESRRMYSWWWDSHINPKNSKWLQENLTDMDTNVKAMIKLIEEDADSFARRAEMYYKKRPELMKLVEEFYRAYRALAERYDNATGALRQAHRTMAEAFPNQIPMILSDESPSPSSSTEVGPHTPEMPSPMHALFGPDDLHKDALGMSSHFHAISRNGAYSEESDATSRKKGLKQLNEMFAAGEGAARAKFSEGKVRKGLNFQEEEGKGFESKIHNGSGEKENFKTEIKRLQEEISQLSTNNQNLKSQFESESEHALNLKDTLPKIESEKEAALLQYQLSQERISNLETEISNTKNELKKLNDEMAMGVMKLNRAEEQCLLLEKANQSLQLELEASEQKEKVQQQELEQSKRDLEKLKNFIQEEHLKAKLLNLELQSGVEKLKEIELSKIALEEEAHELKEINGNLIEQNLSCVLKIKDLQDEMICLNKKKGRLEDEVGLYVEEKKALQQEIYSVKEDRDDLEQKHQDQIEQMEAVSLNVESLQTMVKELQYEKLLLLENLRNVEVVSEKNAVLENSLSDANVELEGLREKAKMLEDSCKSLHDEVSTHVAEKVVLVSQLETISQNMEKLSGKNTLLDSSLSDVNAELEGFNGKLKCLEESCRSLNDQNSSLLAEKNALVSQVESITPNLENMVSKYSELEEKYSNLERERDSTVHRVMELEHSLRLEKQEHEALIQASKSQLATLENQLHLLQEKGRIREEEFEVEQQKTMNAMLEIFILQRCLCDTKDKNLFLSRECQKLLEASRCAEKLISQLEHKDLVQNKKILLLSEHYEKLREGALLLSKALNIVKDCWTMDGNGIEDKVVLQIILGEIRNLHNSISDAQDENQHLHLEMSVLVTLLRKIGLEKLDLYREVDSQIGEVLVLQSKKHEVMEMNKQLRQDVKASDKREKVLKAEMVMLCQQLSDSHETHQISQTEISKLLEENRSLYDQNSSLLAEKNDLVYEVENIRGSLESLGSRYALLEYKRSNLELERDSTVHQVMELENSLRLEKQEHEALLLSSKSQLATLENQIHLLQEEIQVKDEVFEMEQQKAMNMLLEIFILQRCLCDLKDNNLILSRESEKHLEASRCAEKVISQLEHKDLIQNKKITMLSEHNEKLREGILLLLNELSIKMECQTLDGIKDEILLQTILGEIKNLLMSNSDAQEGNQHLHLEMLILLTLLKQIGMEKNLLFLELESLSEELLVLQSKKHEVMEMNKQLRQDLQVSNQREEVLKAEMEILCEKLSNLHGAHQTSQTEISKLLEENRSLSKKLYTLRENKEALEEENSEVLAEAMTLDHLYLLFRSLSSERAVELELFSEDIGCLLAVKNDLNEEIGVNNERMRMLEVENMQLTESAAYLEECISRLVVLEFDLNSARNFCEDLNFQMETGKNLLIQKEMELSDAQNKNTELCRELEGVYKDMDGAKAVRVELEKKILTLSEGNASKDKEIRRVREANEMLHEDLGRLNSEVEVCRRREKHLTSELQKGIDEVGRCEGEIIALLIGIQTSTVEAAVFEEKVLELIVACESLEICAMLQREMLDQEIALRNACADEWKKNLDELGGENKALMADLNAYFSLVASLWDSIASLEEHTLLLSSLQGKQDDSFISIQNENNIQELSEDDSTTPKAGLLELQKLIAKVEALRTVITDTKSLLLQERLDSSANLEAARIEIEELKLKESYVQNSKERYGQTMKDIQLDQVSSSLAYRLRRMETSEPGDQMLELWETAERDDIEAVEEEESECPSSKLVAEKELSVDKLEVSTKAKESPQEWNKSITEMLTSDAQRLLVLQTSLQGVKTKMESSGEKKQPKSLEYDTVKVQLREAEEAIFEQVDINGKLKEEVEFHSESSNGVIRERSQISERAQRESEKIGKLELELQRIEYILLKIEDEIEKKRAWGGDRRSVLLREHLSGRRGSWGWRKGPFCGCIRPKTEG